MTINHQETVTKLASSLEEISWILPEIDATARLYPVKAMTNAIANLYAQILKFCIKATKWYSRNSFMHMVAAVTKPWELEFASILAQIETHSNRVRNLANLALKAEIRDIHIMTVKQMERNGIQIAFGKFELVHLRLHVVLLKEEGDETTNLGTTLPALLPLAEPTANQRFQIANIEQYLLSTVPDPADTLRVATRIRDRRRSRRGMDAGSIWASRAVRDWISVPSSSILEVKSSAIRSDASKDFALDIIELAVSANLPAAWCLTSSRGASTCGPTDILKSLIRQFAGQSLAQEDQPTKVTENWFRQCKSADDWLALFIAVLEQIPRALIVIDANESLRPGVEGLGAFWNNIMDRSLHSVVKVLLVSHVSSSVATLSPARVGRVDSVYQVSVDKGRRPGSGRAQTLVARRNSRSKGLVGPSQILPFFLNLVGSETKGQKGKQRA